MVTIANGNPFAKILWRQWIAATAALLILFTVGLMVGWTSPYLAQLTADDSPLQITTDEASWVASFLNLGRFIGAIIGGFSVQYFGSKHTLFVSGIPMILSWICVILADSVIWLYVARTACGTSFGIASVSFPLYLGEISSPKIRGALVTWTTTGYGIGVLVGNIMGTYISMSIFSYISLVPNVAFMLFFMWIPQSPHHLVRRGRMEDAEKAIALYNPNVDSKVEVESLKNFIEASGTLTLRVWLRELSSPRNRKCGMISALLYFFMHFSGLNSVMFYLEIILIASKITVIPPATAVIVAGAIGVVAGWISVYVADKLKRKVVMIISSGGVCISLIALGTHFALLDNGFDPKTLQWLSITSVIAFQFFLYNGVTSVPNMILSELFAPQVKSMAACVANIAVGVFSFTSSKSYQPLVDAIGQTYVIWIHAIIMICAVIFGVTLMPETKGKTLQEIQDELGRK